jgi:hypothetical protein
MDKDTILKLSRKEHENNAGEWELFIQNKANTIGHRVGLIVCVILALADDFLFHTRVIGMAAWIVYFAMVGSAYLILYRNNRRKSKLIFGILMILCAIIESIVLSVFCMR